MKYLFCAYREWAIQLYNKLSKRYKSMILMTSPNKLSLKNVKRIDPKFIFFPDWSWKVPVEILSHYKCICFHESALPQFRGGSPLQNQIIKGKTKTKTTAFLMDDGIDTGNILLRENLSLEGSLKEIFERMIKNDHKMIIKIINGQYRINKQQGKSTFFKRRKPEQSKLKHLNYSKKYLYNFIRMLADPYPNAFLKIDKKRIVFKSADYDGKKLTFQGELI